MDITVKPYHVGVALLIANQYKKGRNALPSTHEDCDNVRELLTKFGYDVYAKTDRNKDQMLACFKSLAQYVYPDNCKRLLVYFSGHGGVNSNHDDCLITEGDLKMISVYQVISTIALPKNDSMVKMFFIDACRGDNDEVEVAVSPVRVSLPTASSNTTTKGAPSHSKVFENILLACSCPPTFSCHIANDSQSDGSQWTNCLIEAFGESKKKESVFSVLTNANILLSEYAKGNKLQTSEFMSTLTEAVYFKIEAEIYKEAKRKYEDEATHKYEKSWSSLSKYQVVDKVKGILYGHTIGDTFGRATKTMDKAKIMERTTIQQQRWSDATDQMLLIMDGVIEHKGKVLKTDFAERVQKWAKHGVPELGDQSCIDINEYHKEVVNKYNFKDHPHRASVDVWEEHNREGDDNRAAMRTSVLGIVDFNDLEWVHENTAEISQTTNADPRCKASCIAITHAIALILRGKYDPLKDNDVSSLISECTEVASKHLKADDQMKLKNYLQAKSWGNLKLTHHIPESTYKALGAGFYALKSNEGFKKTIVELVMEAGDTNRNCAVAGALLGCKFGFKQLPEDLKMLMVDKHKEVFDQKVQRFLCTLGLS